MIARQFVWTNERVVKLSEKFVPAADEVGRLQRGTDPDCRLFNKIAEQGHYGGSPGTTRQGTYAAAPSGILLASANTNNPDEMANMLERALKKWDTLSREQRLLPPNAKYAPLHRPDAQYPVDGLVLKGVCRDAPRDNVKPVWRHAWNVEFTWFRKEEAKGFAPPEAKVGAVYEVPQKQVQRLARFSLRDIVRGESDPFDEKFVRKATLTGKVTAVDGSRVQIEFSGETQTSQEGKWSIEGLADDKPTPQKRGYEAKILGHAEYDSARGKFSTFELVALGPRWGGTQFNVRKNDMEAFPMVVVLQLAGETPAEHVAPAYLYDYGW